MKRLLAILILLAPPAVAQKVDVRSLDVGDLPATCKPGRMYNGRDAANGTDVTTGGGDGSTPTWARCNADGVSYTGVNPASGGGDVTGPATSTDNAVARFDGTGGTTLQNSGVTIDDSDNIATTGTVDGVDISARDHAVFTPTAGVSTDHGAGSVDISADTNLTAGTGAVLTGDALSVDHDAATNFVAAEHVDWAVRSMFWPAGAMSADGTQCADPAEVTINSGPIQYTAVCTDNDASTLYGHVVMPDGWDAGTVTFELAYLQTAADTSALNSDIAAQCHGAGETVDSTWGTEVAIDDAAVTGSNAVDMTVSGAVAAAGTCAAGDALWWRWQLDATGTTTAVATLHFLGLKMEYTASSGD